LLVASKLNATGHVFAFEPAKRNNDYLEQNVELNHFSNVTLVNKAV
jgi:FkbM family methyltransferase